MRGYNQNVQRNICRACCVYVSFVSERSLVPSFVALSNIHKIEAPPSKVKLWQQRVGNGGKSCLEVVRRPASTYSVSHSNNNK
jgi:hypothetical protein